MGSQGWGWGGVWSEALAGSNVKGRARDKSSVQTGKAFRQGQACRDKDLLQIRAGREKKILLGGSPPLSGARVEQPGRGRLQQLISKASQLTM